MTPSQHPQPEEGIFFDIVPEPAGKNRIYVNFYDAGIFSIEVSREELQKLQMHLNTFLGCALHIPTHNDNDVLDKQQGKGNGRVRI
jgi:hypothetical protein